MSDNDRGMAGAATKNSAAGRPRLGFFHRRFGRWIALSQYGFPFSIGPYPTPVSRLRALARRSRGAGRRLRFFANIAMTLGWPLGAFSAALRTQSQMRARGHASHGADVLFDMYWLALRYSIPPLEYALYRFYDPARRAAMHQYVYWNDGPGFAALNRRCGADNRDVQDKDRFAEICAAHGFAHVPTLALFAGGQQVFPAGSFVQEAPVLWVKALRLSGGAGGAKWTRDGDDYCDKDGRRVTSAKLAEELRKQDCLLQPFVENHPEIARVSNGALAAVRIVTGMNEEGKAEFVTAQIGLPHGPWTTSVASIMGSIDAATGCICRAAMPDNSSVTHHPDTGVEILGLSLPFWQESLALVLRAHEKAFPRFVTLGWDVALTPEGPVLLETNSGWGAMYHQMLDGPLGDTAFSCIVGSHV
jgi:hypothetical protein